MKNIKFLKLVVFILPILICGIVIFNTYSVSAKDSSRFDTLTDQNSGFEERAKKAGISDVKKLEIEKPNNKDLKNNIKSVEQMKGYIKDENLKNDAKYNTKELLTYENFLEKYPQFDLDLTIDKNRMVWVTLIHYPNGFQHKRGLVSNALLTKYYDAETGELYGYSLSSLDSNGNGIKLPNP